MTINFALCSVRSAERALEDPVMIRCPTAPRVHVLITQRALTECRHLQAQLLRSAKLENAVRVDEHEPVQVRKAQILAITDGIREGVRNRHGRMRPVSSHDADHQR